jgi:catechol 2,3-dioxygenase-like lactoylglutathione lyase family enzyme
MLAPMASIARFHAFALDCPDPRALAEFYSAITGWPIADGSSEEWVYLASDTGAHLAFQRVPEHQPPQWPGHEHPQQAHPDFACDDLDAGEAAVLAIGARKHEVQPDAEWRVFVDPAGHPFCLVPAGD